MAPNIEYLSVYLRCSRLDGSTELISYDEELDIVHTPHWNGPTCLALICYVIKFCSILENDKLCKTIRSLNSKASAYVKAVGYEAEERCQAMREGFNKMFVKSFMPKVRKFFTVPKLNEVSDKDSILKKNEILASFLDFLLQILNSEAHINSNKEHQYDLLQKELTFLLSLLGDTPFRWTEHEDVKKILAGFESLANEAGNFIYSGTFSTLPVKASRFIEARNSLMKMVELLNVKIKEHCIKFSELPACVTRTCDAIDSSFIIVSLIEDLENLMNNQFDLIINDEMKVQIKTLLEELMLSRSFLKDFGMQQDTLFMDELNESLVQIRDVAYEAEYLVNSYVVGNFPLWYLNIRLPAVISKIKLIGTRLHEIKTIYDIKVINIKKDFSGEVSNQAIVIPTTMIDDIVVGFEDERTKLLCDLTGGSKNRQIISIFGMPGLGKTTIANKLFIDRSITDHFDERGWCVVSQTYQKSKVLIDILMSLSNRKIENNILTMEDESLSLKIHQCLKNRRYLVVIDDIWSTNVWDDLERFFPDDGNGSRIILTSRIRDVSPTNSIVHSLPLLKEDQCWRLLEKKVFPKELCPPQLQEIGKQIAAKCGGLALAVIVVAGILINLEKEKSVWEKVKTNLNSYIFDDDTNDCSKILELSYKHLPNQLKLCFLYFGAYPEDTIISVQKLVWFWIAEGFIQREQEKSPEQVAEEYLWDLINRSLVQIAKRKSNGGIKTCYIHDLLRDMCLRKAHEQYFSKSVKEYFPIYEKHYRMFVPSKSTAGVIPFGLHYRSFVGHLSQPSSRFPQMKLLRVMDLWPNSNSSYELERIDLLVQLRYLAVDRMPKPLVGNFVNLEFLIIDSTETFSIPPVILKLVKLRHLNIKKEAEFGEDCDSFQTTNLMSLSNICIKNDKDEEILRCSPHLRKLKCVCANETIFPDFHSFTDLEILSMESRCRFTSELTNTNFPSTIRKLTLGGIIGLPWEEISIIGMLPNLHVLKLAERAFVGEEWTTSDGEFQELRVLKFDRIFLNEWITCREHFPKLEHLELSQCYWLTEIPSEIGDIPTLQTIELISCGYKELCKSVVQIEQEQRENGNEELQVIIKSFIWSKEELVRELQQLDG